MKNPVFEYLDGKLVEYNGTPGVFKVREDINGQHLLYLHNADAPIVLSREFTTYVDAATQLGYVYKKEHDAFFSGDDLKQFLGAIRFVKLMQERTDLRADPVFKQYAVEAEGCSGGAVYWLTFKDGNELATDLDLYKEALRGRL
jgi:hypothetical protein